MKSFILVVVGLVGSLVSLSAATATVGAQSTEIEKVYGVQDQELSRDHGHGGGGHGHHGHYHHTQGTELFSGDEWLLIIPLLIVPLIALGCWYFWGGRGGHDDYGWDRMGYSSSNAGAAYTGAYGDARGADALDKSTHQRIFNSIQQ